MGNGSDERQKGMRGQKGTRQPSPRRRKGADPALLRLLLFSGVLIGVLVILLVFRKIFLPLILGFTLAYLFHPMVSWFEKRGRSRVTGVIVLALLLVLVITGFFLVLIPQMGKQLHSLAEQSADYWQRLREWAEPVVAQVRDLVEKYQGEAAATAETTTQEGDEPAFNVLAEIEQTLKGILPKVTSWVAQGLQQGFSGLLSAVLFLLNLIFVPVFAFYLLVDFPHIQQGARDLIPRPYRQVTLERLREVDDALSSFVRGQLTIALILGVLNAIGLMILGVPLGLVIGLVAGLANMIPYMSIVVGLIPALLLAWVEHQNVWILVGVAAVFAGTQMLEGIVLSPRILGKSVNLHPVWVLLAILVGGSLFGFFGMLIAVPTAAVIQVFVRHWLKTYHESAIYLGSETLDPTDDSDSGDAPDDAGPETAQPATGAG